jgi:hypothetical protein
VSDDDVDSKNYGLGPDSVSRNFAPLTSGTAMISWWFNDEGVSRRHLARLRTRG